MSGADRWRVPDEAAGERLDRYLAERYRVARNRVAGWIRDGRVRLEDGEAKASTRLAAGQRLACEPRAVEQPLELEPEKCPLSVVYEEPALVVIDKPAGLVVHPGAGRRSGTLVHRALSRYPEMAAVGGPGRPGIVHRLDRDTTGLLVLARTPAAYAALSRAFAERAVFKQYLAVVYGAPRPPDGTLDLPIGRHPLRRKEMTVRERGRAARTHYRTVASRFGLSLLAVRITTGRTHQIRVHLKALRCPLVGDPVYGEARWRGLPRARQAPPREFSRPALHAWRLGLPHPDDGRPLRFESAPPADLERLWRDATGEALPPLPPWPDADGEGP